jgi:rubrerythrin
MAHNFSVDDVFEMAEMMERNGADFYRKTAETTKDPKLKEFLVGLSNLELSHAAMFRRWREELAGVDAAQKRFDPEDEGAQYLKAIVDGQVSFEHEEHGTDSLEEILKGAIASEKDTVIFYLNMRESIPDYLGASKIDRIIREELEHIRAMTRKMRQLSLERTQKQAS